MRCHPSGSWSFWVMANTTGRPVRAANVRIHAISRSGAARSSPSAPAGASSNTPAPASARASPMPKSSASAANVPGTGSPSMAMWATVRDVEKPSAPASMPSRTIAAISAMSSLVAASLRAPRSPITYARTEPWGISEPTSSASGRSEMTSRNSGYVSQPHLMPSLSAAPGMSSTPSIKPMSHSCLSGRTGANPTPQLPMTTVVTPCQHDGVSVSSQVI